MSFIVSGMARIYPSTAWSLFLRLQPTGGAKRPESSFVIIDQRELGFGRADMFSRFRHPPPLHQQAWRAMKSSACSRPQTE